MIYNTIRIKKYLRHFVVSIKKSCIFAYQNKTKEQIKKIGDKKMTAQQVKETLSANRQIVIDFFIANVKEDRFYTLKWFMERVLVNAEASWKRRVNVGEKEVKSVLNNIMKNYPVIAKGYKSNFQKAAEYFGYNKAKQIANAK